MKSRQLFFFALKEDLLDLVAFIETTFDIRYAQAGLEDSPPPYESSLKDIVDSYHLEYGNWNFNESYLIFPKGQNIHIREVLQRAGGIKFAVDQSTNEDSVILSLGGMYNDKAVIASKVGTISNTPFATEIMKGFKNYLKRYNNIKGYYVSPHALQKAMEGKRLTTDVNSPVEYDLNIND